jgi:hypothetical protein
MVAGMHCSLDFSLSKKGLVSHTTAEHVAGCHLGSTENFLGLSE